MESTIEERDHRAHIAFYGDLVITLSKEGKEVDTFRAKDVALYDTKCIQDWLSNNGAACLCSRVAADVQRFNEQKKWGFSGRGH